jgi:hypothetical protein
MDIIGRFDPKTGKVVEYPFPQSELSMREFFRDTQGRMWFGLSFAKSLCPTLDGFLPAWRKLFGLGLQADSSIAERCSQMT